MKFFFPCLLREFLCGKSVSRFFMNHEIPSILWNLKVITMFIRAQLLFLSRATLIQLTPCHPISYRCILISLSNWCLHLPSGLLLCVSLEFLVCVCIFHMCTTCPIYFILLDLITQTVFGRKYIAYSNNPFYVFVLLYYFLLIRCKYLSQHSVLNHLQSMFFT
jgi:hypothetical protein